MRASKPLASVVAAAAVVGAIGLAYAQTPDTSTTTPGASTDQTMQNQGTSGSTTGTSSSTSADTAVTPTERPAQADRN
jgi:hypothetical protein